MKNHSFHTPKSPASISDNQLFQPTFVPKGTFSVQFVRGLWQISAPRWAKVRRTGPTVFALHTSTSSSHASARCAAARGPFRMAPQSQQPVTSRLISFMYARCYYCSFPTNVFMLHPLKIRYKARIIFWRCNDNTDPAYYIYTFVPDHVEFFCVWICISTLHFPFCGLSWCQKHACVCDNIH